MRRSRKGVKITPPSREHLDRNQRERAKIKRSAVQFVVENGVEYARYPHSPRKGPPLVEDLTMRRAVWDALWRAYPECYPKVRTGGNGAGFWRLHGIRVNMPARDAPIARVVATLLGKPPKASGWRAVCLDGNNSNLRDENIVLAAANLTRASPEVVVETWKRMRMRGMRSLGGRVAIQTRHPLRAE